MIEKDTNLPPKKRKVSENTGLDRTEPKSASENVKSEPKSDHWSGYVFASRWEWKINHDTDR